MAIRKTSIFTLAIANCTIVISATEVRQFLFLVLLMVEGEWQVYNFMLDNVLKTLFEFTAGSLHFLFTKVSPSSSWHGFFLVFFQWDCFQLWLTASKHYWLITFVWNVTIAVNILQDLQDLQEGCTFFLFWTGFLNVFLDVLGVDLSLIVIFFIRWK